MGLGSSSSGAHYKLTNASGPIGRFSPPLPTQSDGPRPRRRIFRDGRLPPHPGPVTPWPGAADLLKCVMPSPPACQFDSAGGSGLPPDHQIPDARASGFIFPIPAKSGFPSPRIPGSRPNRDSRFPESRDPGQIGIQIRENPDFFAAARTVISHCQRQARLVRFLIGVPGWEKRLIVHCL
jgi:hypothetical protein